MKNIVFIFSISSTIYSFLNDDSDSTCHKKEKVFGVYK